MVLVPPRYDDPELLSNLKMLLAPCGFGSFSVTTAQEHDSMIAFTSQMPHIISNAYIKSPTALDHKGFSAGSYKDLTRVAWLNPHMWAELFLTNKENILHFEPLQRLIHIFRIFFFLFQPLYPALRVYKALLRPF